MIRETCGTVRGLLAHQVAGERPCGWCAQAEQAARLSAERITWVPPSPRARLLPVTPEEAAANAALLDHEVAVFEAPSGRRRLLLVKPEDAA